VRVLLHHLYTTAVGEIRERSLGYGQGRIGLSMQVCEPQRTLVNGQIRIVALEEVAGSSPVGHPAH
jgi:hypothetical protein